ncbi:hypothetical protein [Gimibacter soli]|uniref:Uncharacterized protein n=1 Tax=Gimibacter soli TaxID=3024400 RepID=A0AAE9XQM1_9PROT|nr:hypothetical protein [Gimibacter soli]WCL54427.1 hypothetical protein PH603_01470 [Gimibacter soli]
MIKKTLDQMSREIEARRATAEIDCDRPIANSGLRRTERKRIILQDMTNRFPDAAIKSNYVPGAPKF